MGTVGPSRRTSSTDTPPRNPVSLTGAQRRALRARGHHLEPVVQLGKSGLSDAVVKATRDALDRHELVKVRLLPECPADRREGHQPVSETA